MLTNTHTKICIQCYLSMCQDVVTWCEQTWCSERLCLPVILALVGLQINER